MTDAPSVIKSAKRVFEVLELFDQVRRPLALKDISAHLEYPTSSTAALLKSLVSLGYLDYDLYSRSYLPTMRIAQLGSWVQSGLFGETAIMALVDHVNDVTGEMVSISTQSDLHAQYIHVVEARHLLRFHLEAGTLRPLARCGVGWLQLSTRSDSEIERLVRRINALETMENRVHLPSLMQRIEQIRIDGFIFSKHTVTKGAGVIGLMLPVTHNARRLAIGVGGPVDRLEAGEEYILRTLRDGVSKFLGG